MKMQELRVIAKQYGINSFGKTKVNLIREIQIAEGNFDCFGSAVEYCDQWGCRYRPLCFDEAKKWVRGKHKTEATNVSKRKRRAS